MLQSLAEVSSTTCCPRAFVGSHNAYEQICAYGFAMGWAERPFDFVVQQWLASRPQPAYEEWTEVRRLKQG